MVGGTVFGRMRLLLLMLFATLLVLPVALARTINTGISPLNRVIEKMAWIFNVPVLNNPTVQIYFLKFMLFIVFLAVAHFAFEKLFDNKTAGVIATAFSLIAAFLMPIEWVLANGGVITAVFTGLIPLGVVGAGLWFTVTKMNDNFVMRLLAIVILFTLLAIIDIYYDVIGLKALLFIPAVWLRKGGRR